MRQRVPSSFVNLALVVGVVFAVTFAIGFTLRYPTPPAQPAATMEPATPRAIRLPLPPPSRSSGPVATKAQPAPTRAAAPPALSVQLPRGLRSAGITEPFDPPPPPMAAAAAMPPPAKPEAPVPTPIPAKAAVALVPARPKAPAPPDIRLPYEEADEDEAVPDTDDRPSGPRLSGRAIVTAALELNVAGKPLRLAGVKLPVSTDLCTPNAGYAARSCADVTRQALTARVGAKGEVSCRILAGGSSAWPAVCTDRAGQDLAAYLVEHGFALADDSDMIDYSAIEARARTAHSGLWSYR